MERGQKQQKHQRPYGLPKDGKKDKSVKNEDLTPICLPCWMHLDMLIEVLTERFGSVSGELSEQIKRIDSRERLKDLIRQALRVKNFDEFGKKVVSN